MTAKRITKFTVSIAVLMMAFGIGINTIIAATPAANTSTLQPATGATEFREEESDQATEEHVAESEHNKDSAATEHEEDPGVIGMFGLNKKLFLAQLINFGIILFVLWKFVFGPVTKGLSQRTEKIEKSLAEAQKISEERETFDSWKQGEMSQVRTEATAIINQAKETAEKLKADTLKATTDEQNNIVEQTKKRLEQEKTAMMESAKAELADIVVQATSTILKAKIDPTKDKKLIDDALKQASEGK